MGPMAAPFSILEPSRTTDLWPMRTLLPMVQEYKEQLLWMTTKSPMLTSAGMPVGREAAVWMTVLSPMETSLPNLLDIGEGELLDGVHVSAEDGSVPEEVPDSAVDLADEGGVGGHVAEGSEDGGEVVEGDEVAVLADCLLGGVGLDHGLGR